MKPVSAQLATCSVILLCLLLLSGCATVQDQAQHQPPQVQQDSVPQNLTVQMPDSSCSYFYLLWGTHAENNQRYQEAEEAIQKALICDPDSRYILRRLPILLLRMGKPLAAAQMLRQAIEQYPDDIQDRILLARLEIRNNEIDKAIQLYEEVLAITPDDEALLLRIGYLHSENNRIVEAETAYKKALAINPDSLFAHLYLARLTQRTGEKKRAAHHYQKAISLNWSVELALEMAQFYDSQSQYNKVAEQYRTILAKHPEDTQAGLGLVHVLLLQEKEGEALTVLEDLRRSSNEPDAIDMVTARLHLRRGDLDKAAATLTPLTLQENNEEAIYMLAVIRYQQKELGKAVELLQKIKSGTDFHEDALFLQVRILMEEKEFARTTSLLQQAIDTHETASPDLYTLLASLYMDQGMFQEGYKTLNTALTVYPENTKVYFEYGLLLDRDNKREEALKQMSAILLLNPDHAEALNYVGYTWADLGINLEQALQYIKKAVELKPDNGYIRDSLGWVYFRMGKLTKATVEIREALKLEPKDPNIHEHLGDIYHKLGDRIKAEQAYKKAQELFKTEQKQSQMQNRINAL